MIAVVSRLTHRTHPSQRRVTIGRASVRHGSPRRSAVRHGAGVVGRRPRTGGVVVGHGSLVLDLREG